MCVSAWEDQTGEEMVVGEVEMPGGGKPEEEAAEDEKE
jgi:hypothetical protein